ncbi:PD-(D/E)XK nuclease family protein [Spongiibacter sp. KMU-158]|uniref:PD-(D/E)XK nuclease family protein n=1 Tax=Spongiibacter pelagi TaxID=2760804 RepID=A0A927GV38_9GAMM|nr:PD-(D/E)XK nuclease family protein [Spongiibacter pelagi]MBD2857658.1 PD-(D/E)XK nuclease family protein [Spongiibacter pelagi]
MTNNNRDELSKLATIASFDDLWALQGTTVLLTHNDVAARQCRDQLAQYQQQRESAFIEQISAMPVEQWLAELWDSGFNEKIVLRPIQLLALAQQLLEGSESFPPQCLNSQAICRRFVDAFQDFHHYRLSDSREHYLFSSEYQAFYQWRKELQHILDEQGALSSAQLPSALSGALKAGELILPDNIILSAGLSLAPAIESFLAECLDHAQVLRLESESAPQAISLHVAENRAEECRQVASEIADYLAASTSPEAEKIAIVCPEISSYRALLEGALCEQLYPATLFPLGTKEPFGEGAPVCEPWLFEGTEKLLGFPLISAAWDCISLRPHQADLEQISRILRSRFIGGWSEWRYARAELDLLWREKLSAQTSLKQALALNSSRLQEKYWGDESGAMTWLDPLIALQAYLEKLRPKQLPSAWVRDFDQLLLGMGWPNAEIDDPVVMQCRKGFSQGMDVFRAMDRQLGLVSHAEAISWLQQILSSKRFSISRNWRSPIVVIGLEEAQGRHFDALWIMGCDEAALPRHAEPSAFLPLLLQQRANMPDSSPVQKRFSDFAVLNNVLATSSQIRFSYFRESDEGVALGVSSLISEWLNKGLDEEARNNTQDERSNTAIEKRYRVIGQTQLPEQDMVAAVSDSERKKLRGGSGLFKEYATSPFFAFAKYRLGLKEFPQPTEGLDHRLQGLLVHNTLEQFWRQTITKAALEALGEAALQERVLACVDIALEDAEVGAWRFPAALIEIEKQRVATLVSSWILQKETQRLSDFRVIEMESERRIEIFGINLRLRLDRVDEIETSDGKKRLVIDYKTGTVEGKSLNSNELSEPQLPIYALTESREKTVDGIMLAQIKSDALSLHMRSNWANSVIKKNASKHDVASPETWQNELSAWSGALETMAAGILGGDIRHDSQRDHRRGFSAYLLPLTAGNMLDEEDAE